jgi:C1A family cysteine protease
MPQLSLPVDWTTVGAVTPVKDQGQCGSCWSFSAVGAMEGAYYVSRGTLPGATSAKTGFHGLSEQHFVDCDNRKNGGSDLGCNGGLMDSAFSWAKKNGGVCSEADYPYVSGTTKTSGTCAESSCTKDAKTAPLSYTDVATNSDTALMSALAQQPVSVAIEADQAAFQLYKSGVFTATCGTNLDHGVLAVGYGTLSGQDYYKVKNSWGSSWGMDGYILLARGVSQKQGQCGILSGPPSYPTITSA